MANSISVAVVITNFHDEKTTQACVNSILESSIRSAKVNVIVVDVDPAQSHDFKGAETLSVKNNGYAASCNAGIRYALKKWNSDYVLTLNNDTLVDKNMLETLVAFAENHKSKHLFVPKIYFAAHHEFHKDSYTEDERGNVLWYAGGLVDMKNVYAWHKGVDEVDLGQHDNSVETAFATGCCMLIPRSVVQSIGYFQQSYFMYLEDVEYSLRLKKAGGKILFVPSAKMWHINAGSSGGSGSPFHVYYQTRNRLAFGLKFGSLRTKFALLKEALRMMKSSVQSERKAVWDGLFGRMGKRLGGI